MNISQKILSERIKGLYQQHFSLITGAFISNSLILFIVWSSENTVPLLSWFACVLLFLVLRSILILKFNHVKEREFNPLKWARAYTIGMMASGITIGLSPVLFLDINNFVAVIFVTIILFGTLAGSISSLVFYLPAYYLYTLLAMMPLIILFFSHGGSLNYIASLLLLYIVLLPAYAKRSEKTATMLIQQRLENVELIKQLETQTLIAEKANLEKTRFLATTNHDLRQPLHSLGLYMSLLKDQLTNEQQRATLLKAEKSQQALSQQFGFIIDIAKIDSGKQNFEPQAIEIKPFIKTLLQDFLPLANNNQCEIKSFIRDTTILADPILLGRVFRNLISNFIYHCPNSKLLIGSRQRSDKLLLSFIDNGPGIPEDMHHQVFLEYYQLDKQNQDQNIGSGLGLSIVKRLTDLMNIPLHLKSKQGKGSHFSLLLPLTKQQSAIQELVVRDEINIPEIAGQFIIVIDDEIENTTAIKSLLKSWECEVLVATNTEDIINEISSNHYPCPDHLLIDYHLNHQTGDNAISLIRDHFKTAIPAIILTGDITISAQKNINLSACRVLYKPLPADELKRELTKNYK